MNLTDIQTIYDYNYWANARLLEAAANVTQEQFTAPGPFPWGGLRGTLVHTLDAEFGWRLFLEHGKWQQDELHEADFPHLEFVTDRWRAEEQLMRAYLATLNDQALGEIVRYTTETGAPRERLRWHCLYHVVNHGTQHRSETAAMLTGFGRSPGDVDFTFFLTQTGRIISQTN